MVMRALGVLSLFSIPLLVACQGRVEPDWDKLPVQEEPELTEQPSEECVEGTRSCLGPRGNEPELAVAGPSHKDPDDIRDGLIGNRPVVASPDGSVDDLVIAGCTDDVFEEVRSAQPGVELHVLSVHDAGEAGEVRVFVERQAAISLVLSSYAATRWVVDFAPGARITEVVLNGSGDQSVEIAEFISVTELEGEQSLGAFGTGGADEKDRHATAELIRGAEEATGLSLRSFHGCQQGTSFSIHGEEAQ